MAQYGIPTGALSGADILTEGKGRVTSALIKKYGAICDDFAKRAGIKTGGPYAALFGDYLRQGGNSMTAAIIADTIIKLRRACFMAVPEVI